MIDNSIVFNSLWEVIAGRMTEELGKEVSMEQVRTKIHRLQTQFNTFNCYGHMPTGVRLDEYTGKITVKASYMARLNEECDIHYQFRQDGFPHYYRLRVIFVKRRAAAIEFGPEPIDDLLGGCVKKLLLIDESDRDHESSGDENEPQVDLDYAEYLAALAAGLVNSPGEPSHTGSGGGPSDYGSGGDPYALGEGSVASS